MHSKDYLELCAATQAAALKGPAPGTPAETEALRRFGEFFSDMTEQRVENEVEEVYAADAYLYDTLATHHGIDEIKPYFLATARRAKGVKVEILGLTREGPDHTVKWLMDITWSAFVKGQTTRSYGMSNLRFNAAGQVILHYDFWDSAHAFYIYIPIVGPLIRFIRKKAGSAG